MATTKLNKMQNDSEPDFNSILVCPLNARLVCLHIPSFLTVYPRTKKTQRFGRRKNRRNNPEIDRCAWRHGKPDLNVYNRLLTPKQ